MSLTTAIIINIVVVLATLLVAFAGAYAGARSVLHRSGQVPPHDDPYVPPHRPIPRG